MVIIILFSCPPPELIDTPPDSPEIKIEKTVFTYIKITWNKNSEQVDYYNILRKNDNKIFKISGNKTSFIDTTTTDNIEYKYQIRAVNKFGTALSNEIAVQTDNKRLICYWKFDENTVNEINNKKLTEITDTGISYIKGIKGSCVSLKNVNGDKLKYTDSPELNLKTFTINVLARWHLLDSGNPPSNSILTRQYYQNNGWRIGFNNYLICQYNWDGDHAYIPVTRNPVTNEEFEKDKWYLLTIIFDNNNKEIKLYINSHLAHTVTIDPEMVIVENQNLWIGSSDEWSSGWNGELDELKIYDYVLSENEINWLWDQYKEEINMENN